MLADEPVAKPLGRERGSCIFLAGLDVRIAAEYRRARPLGAPVKVGASFLRVVNGLLRPAVNSLSDTCACRFWLMSSRTLFGGEVLLTSFLFDFVFRSGALRIAASMRGMARLDFHAQRIIHDKRSQKQNMRSEGRTGFELTSSTIL